MKILFFLSLQFVSLLVFISCLGIETESNSTLSSSSPITDQTVAMDSMQFIVIIEGLGIDSISFEVYDDSSQILSLEKSITSVSDPQSTILIGLHNGVEYTVSYKCFQNGLLIAQQLELLNLNDDLIFYSIPDKILTQLSLGDDRTLLIGEPFSFSFDIDDDSPLITMTFDYLGDGNFIENDRWVYASVGTYHAVVKVVDAFSTAFDTVVVIIVDPAVADVPSSNSFGNSSSTFLTDQFSSGWSSSEFDVYSSTISSSLFYSSTISSSSLYSSTISSSSLYSSTVSSSSLYSSAVSSSSLSSSTISSSSSIAPSVENSDLLCLDNADNDGDGTTDCEDTDCQVLSVCIVDENTDETCNDGVDNDFDGDFDCDDADCAGVNRCKSFSVTYKNNGYGSTSGDVTVDYGGTLALVHTPQSNYLLSSVTITSGSAIVNSNTSIIDITSNITVYTTYELPTYIITLRSFQDGSVIDEPIFQHGEVSNISTAVDDFLVFDRWEAVGSNCFVFGAKNANTTVNCTGPATIYAHFKNKALGTVTDSRDSKTYGWTRINDQIWMTENIDFEVDSSWAVSSYLSIKMGRMYTWGSAMIGGVSSNEDPSGVQGICTPGWHIPSNAEWEKLLGFIASDRGEGSKSGWSWTHVGKYLRTELGAFWGGAVSSDIYGFNAVPIDKIRSWVTAPGTQMNYVLNGYANWWTSTEQDATGAYIKMLGSYSDNVSEVQYEDISKAMGYSVRCVKNP